MTEQEELFAFFKNFTECLLTNQRGWTDANINTAEVSNAKAGELRIDRGFRIAAIIAKRD